MNKFELKQNLRECYINDIYDLRNNTLDLKYDYIRYMRTNGYPINENVVDAINDDYYDIVADIRDDYLDIIHELSLI